MIKPFTRYVNSAALSDSLPGFWVVEFSCGHSGILQAPSNRSPVVGRCSACESGAAVEVKPSLQTAEPKPPVQADEPSVRPSWLRGGLEALEMVRQDMSAAEPLMQSADSRPPESMVDALDDAAFSGVPFSIVNERRAVNFDVVKPQAQDSANEKPEPVPAPAAPRELRLLCVLDVLSPIERPRYIPAGTMHRLSPRASVQGRWSLEGDAFYQLRSAHPKRPTAEVLVRCERHRQANSVCSIT